MFDQLLSASWLSDLLSILIQTVMVLTSILLLPISAIIAEYIPAFDAALVSLSDVFALALTYMGWIISAFAIPTALLSLVAGYYTFVVVTKLGTWGVKLGLSWYHALK